MGRKNRKECNFRSGRSEPPSLPDRHMDKDSNGNPPASESLHDLDNEAYFARMSRSSKILRPYPKKNEGEHYHGTD